MVWANVAKASLDGTFTLVGMCSARNINDYPRSGLTGRGATNLGFAGEPCGGIPREDSILEN